MEALGIEVVADAFSTVYRNELGLVLLRCLFGWGFGFVCYQIFRQKDVPAVTNEPMCEV